jgi:ribonuclease III
MKNIEILFTRLGYSFSKTEIIKEALRHSSYVNENKELRLKDNERLEFLGDAVLDLAVSHILMDRFSDLREGDLSKYRAAVVNEAGLCRVARFLELGEYILLGKGEEMTNGREKPSILANTMESVLGALYLDAGFEKTLAIITMLFQPVIEGIKSKKTDNDYKSMLQEFTQEQMKTLPEYILIEENGLPHNKTFRVAVKIGETPMAEGTGRSKKEAEQNAAREAFYCLANPEEEI